jgi:type IV fimbrial biogenesis protein FimT
MRHAGLPAQHGASLIEIVTAMALLTTLLGLGAPAVIELQHSTALSSATWDLLADLNLARAEALKRNRRVTLCKSADGRQCASTGGWEQGWIVFHDENDNGTAEADEPVIARHGALAGGLRVNGNKPVAAYVSYTPMGGTRLAGGGFQAGTMTLCRRSATPAPGREVILNALGRPRSQTVTVDLCG